ncbi:hypothetical protein DC094_02915 [Pelagibaculum spongiae]|uniref:Uncharacterized protein n=1 Tax=Pelagibaculum spongiae TaxID=2080658 RepID=A0A2V1H436_9GAMM|nr:hypothetical protein DC094_02915 [Pelagibaculum spongiae]
MYVVRRQGADTTISKDGMYVVRRQGADTTISKDGMYVAKRQAAGATAAICDVINYMASVIRVWVSELSCHEW